MPILGLDYFFLTSKGVSSKEELEMNNEDMEQAREEGTLVKCLVVRCFASKLYLGTSYLAKASTKTGSLSR